MFKRETANKWPGQVQLKKYAGTQSRLWDEWEECLIFFLVDHLVSIETELMCCTKSPSHVRAGYKVTNWCSKLQCTQSSVGRPAELPLTHHPLLSLPRFWLKQAGRQEGRKETNPGVHGCPSTREDTLQSNVIPSLGHQKTRTFGCTTKGILPI